MFDLTLKPFNVDLIDECVDLYMETYSKEPWNESWESKDEIISFYKNHCANNYFLGFVAMKDKNIVGVSVGFLKPWIKGMEYYIDDFFVSSGYQRQGLGSKFMNEIKDELIKKNIHAIILSTERDYPSHKFYEKIGFNVLQDTVFLGMTF